MGIQDTCLEIVRYLTATQRIPPTAWDVFNSYPREQNVSCFQVSTACLALLKAGRIKSVETMKKVRDRHYYVEGVDNSMSIVKKLLGEGRGLSPEDLAYRKQKFDVKVGSDAWLATPGEVELKITHNGTQWWAINLLPEEVDRVVQALTAHKSANPTKVRTTPAGAEGHDQYGQRPDSSNE